MIGDNPFTEAFFQDPYPVYRQMRDQESPYWLETPHDAKSGGCWMFTRYDEVKDLLRKAHDAPQDIKRLIPESQRTAFHYMLLYSDPPDHTRLRSLISTPFSRAGVNRLDAMITRQVDQLLDVIQEHDEVDFIAAFAEPLPVNVISELLGTPIEDATLLRDWTVTLGRGFDSTINDPVASQRGVEALQEMTRYFTELMARPNQPPGTIIESLKNDSAAQKCSPQEAMAQCMLLLLAGHETTLSLLGNAMYCLLTNPGELAKLRQQPELLDSMINEVLRFEAPFQRAVFRVAAEPITCRGHQIQVGERISPVVSAANRDPAQFAEPDRFDIERKPNRHLAFGLGIHRCLGEKLARSEARIAIGRLLQRFPHLQAVESKPRWKARSLFRTLQSLPVKPG
ncbi:cytochrome P450 [Elongatibacter sediminis]|uniref:Cytochrome P450 n=1 Tax=Elongatibacter sediminis TaxID=3119006 RepID=A0AAW9R8L1_9GAMM